MYISSSCCSLVVYWVSAPFQRWDQNPPFIIFATMPNPYLLEPQTHLTQIVVLLGKCPELQLASLVFLPTKRCLASLTPSPRCALSSLDSIRDWHTISGEE